jgi:hypothetical protein
VLAKEGRRGEKVDERVDIERKTTERLFINIPTFARDRYEGRYLSAQGL